MKKATPGYGPTSSYGHGYPLSRGGGHYHQYGVPASTAGGGSGGGGAIANNLPSILESANRPASRLGLGGAAGGGVLMVPLRGRRPPSGLELDVKALPNTGLLLPSSTVPREREMRDYTGSSSNNKRLSSSDTTSDRLRLAGRLHTSYATTRQGSDDERRRRNSQPTVVPPHHYYNNSSSNSSNSNRPYAAAMIDKVAPTSPLSPGVTRRVLLRGGGDTLPPISGDSGGVDDSGINSSPSITDDCSNTELAAGDVVAVLTGRKEEVFSSDDGSDVTDSDDEVQIIFAF